MPIEHAQKLGHRHARFKQRAIWSVTDGGAKVVGLSGCGLARLCKNLAAWIVLVLVLVLVLDFAVKLEDEDEGPR